MRNNTFKYAIAVATAMSMSQVVVAQTPTAAELVVIQSKTAFVKAQTELAKAQAELASARGTSPTAVGKPKIVAIMKFGGDTTATLKMPDGSPVEARVRDTLPDGSVVTSIRANGVTLKKSGESMDLGFVSSDAAMSTSNSSTPAIPFGMSR